MNIDSSNILSSKANFEVFFKAEYDSLCRFAFTFLKDPDDAEEVVQNCFVKLWDGRKSIEIGDFPKSYLFKMIRNASLNQIKHISIREDYKAYNERVNQESETVEDQIEFNELQDKVSAVIQKMPPQRKRVFEMSRFEGLKYREIAEHLNLSVKTVENHMGSAIKYLRTELKEYLHLAIVIYLINGMGGFLFSVVLIVGS